MTVAKEISAANCTLDPMEWTLEGDRKELPISQ